MAIGNGALMQECFPKHSCMDATIMKYDKETEEEGKTKRGTSLERSKAVRKKVDQTA